MGVVAKASDDASTRFANAHDTMMLGYCFDLDSVHVDLPSCHGFSGYFDLRRRNAAGRVATSLQNNARASVCHRKQVVARVA